MAVRQIAPENKRERKRFVMLEPNLFRDEPLYVPPIASDVNKYLRGRSPFYEEMEYSLFIASNNRDLARCAALINRRWQRDKGENAGFIGYFAAASTAQAEAGEMLDKAERWLSERGANRAVAPFNGAAFHGLGALTDAFDEEPIFPYPWQPPNHPQLLESAGYRPTYPFWVYEIDFSSDRYRTVAERALTDLRCTVRPLGKKHWVTELETLRTVFNETFRDEWEFHEMTSPEFRELFDQFKPVLDPRTILFAEVDGEPAGVLLRNAGLDPTVSQAQGQDGPLQIVRVLLRPNRYDNAGLIAIGVRESQRGKHIGQTLAANLYRRYEELGLTRAYYYPVNDHNRTSRRLAESLGGHGRILYTVFDKPLK